ncbi:hypothetical protein ABZX92_09660, partial [Lentzea sp. NPDC006480]
MTTAGKAPGQAQANLIAIPKDWAYDFLLFTHRNPKPCPVLDVLDAGETVSALKRDADVRTHAPRYRIWEHGELVAEPENRASTTPAGSRSSSSRATTTSTSTSASSPRC